MFPTSRTIPFHLLASVCLALAVPAGATEIRSAPPLIRRGDAPAPRRLEAPVSVQQGLWEIDADIKLAPLDHEKIRREDAKRADLAKPLRIGAFRDLPAKTALDKGTWTELDDGRHLWRLTLEVPGAKGLRVLLEDLVLPEGASLVVFSTLDPNQLQGPYFEHSFGDRNSFWTNTVFAERITVELVCDSLEARRGASFRIGRLIEVYRDPVAEKAAKVGDCQNNIACHRIRWREQSNAVGGLGTVGQSGMIWCTGSMINDTDDSTEIPYYITAHHCVENQRSADALEFYWFYDALTCGSVNGPDLARVPRTTGGADYLSSSPFFGGNDFAFMRLRNDPPNNVTFLGWTTASLVRNEDVTGIHHPDGSHKRISFGNEGQGTNANYWEVVWNDGTTEPGSSGSPLFNEDKLFIGQLWGGSSACDDGFQNLPDYYGRFNITYAFIRGWLDPDGGDDAYEENDSLGTAYDLTFNPRQWLSSLPQGEAIQADADWFKIETAPGLKRLYVRARFTHSEGNIDLRLVDSSGADVVPVSGNATSTSSTGTETIDCTVQTEGTYYVVVEGDNAGNEYDLWWNNNGGGGGGGGGFNPDAFTIDYPNSTFMPPIRTTRNDFDGDRKSDVGAYHPASGTWYIYRSRDGFTQTVFGEPDSLPVTGDFDGDGKYGIGFYGRRHQWWNIRPTGDGEPYAYHWGVPDAVPVTGDFDGDGATDTGIYQEDTGLWSLTCSTYGTFRIHFGFRGALPVVADIDGDRRDDMGVYYPPTGSWYFFQSSTERRKVFTFGFAGTVPVVGDLDGDGKDDVGCYHAPTGSWYFWKSTEGFVSFQFGFDGTIPVVGDYDGDLKDDIGCYYPPLGLWFIYMSNKGFQQYQFGFDGTLPIK